MVSKPQSSGYIRTILETMAHIHSAVQQQCRQRGMSLVRMNVLRGVLVMGSPTMKDLANHLQVTMPTATVLIRDLVKIGLVDRIEDERDRRIVRIVFTDKGRATIDREMKLMATQMKEDLALLSDDEQRSLAEIMQKIYRRFKRSDL